MAKKSQKRSPRHERVQAAGCIWGFMSIFDLRHGQSNKKLLADKKYVNKQAVGAEPSRIETALPNLAKMSDKELDAEESKNDDAKISVKELMEEEMCNEEISLINKSNDSDEMCLEEIDDSRHGRLVRKNHKRKKRAPSKSNDMDVSGMNAATFVKLKNFHEVPEKKISDNPDWETILEELARFNERNLNPTAQDFPNDIDMPSATAVDEKLAAAIKLVIQKRTSHGQHFEGDEKLNCSEELIDALQTLSLNKRLFMKLLKDPNFTIVKNRQNLEAAPSEKDQGQKCLPESNLPQDNETNRRKHHNFFRRRTKSMESFPMMRDIDSQSSSKIVVLKSGPAAPQTDIGINNEAINARNMSQFSFSEIKRRLRNAMGKERGGIPSDALKHNFSLKHQNADNTEKGATGENLGWSSPNRNHFYTEKFAKSSIKRPELDDKSKSDSLRHGPSNIYIEAKKHLTEILTSGEEKAAPMSIQLPKSLGRILSLPEYTSSPCWSPQKQGDDMFVTAQMRLSPRGVVRNSVGVPLLENQIDNSSFSDQILESRPQISCSNSEDKLQFPKTDDNRPTPHDEQYSFGLQSFSGDAILHDVHDSSSRVMEIEGMAELMPPKDDRFLDDSSETSNDSITGDIKVENSGSASRCFEDSSGYIKVDISEDDTTSYSQVVSYSHSSASREVEDSECSIDKMERPSPVSILEPLFIDDEISPSNLMSHSVGKEIQPRCIHFEEQSSANDQSICTKISLEDEESAFEYVEAILLGSGLNWDEFLLKWLSLSEILSSSLFDEVELYSSRSRDDQKLLFDCANEALKEVCENYFAVSSVKHKIKPVPKSMDLINEVWYRVERFILEHVHPHSLDQLIKRDLARSGEWVSLQYDVEDISFEIGDDIFDDLMEDTVLSFVDDSSYHGFKEIQADPFLIEESRQSVSN